MPIILVVWFLAVCILGATGVATRLQPPMPQVVLLAITAILIVAGRTNARLRAWLMSRDWRAIVALHLWRAVAAGGFFWAASRGVLPARFALPAAYGDLIVAIFAFALITLVPPTRPGARGAFLAWNVLGLVDILFVVVNAGRVAMADPDGMHALLQLPFILLPLFLVPLVIATHLLLFVRLREPA